MQIRRRNSSTCCRLALRVQVWPLAPSSAAPCSRAASLSAPAEKACRATSSSDRKVSSSSRRQATSPSSPATVRSQATACSASCSVECRKASGGRALAAGRHRLALAAAELPHHPSKQARVQATNLGGRGAAHLMLGVDVRHGSLHCVEPQLHDHLLAAGMHQLLGRQLRRVAGEAVGQAAAPPLQGGGTAAQAVAGASPRAGRGAASPSCAPGRSCSETCANCGRWIRGSLRCSDGVMQQPGPQNSAKTAGEGADGSIWECPPAFLWAGRCSVIGSRQLKVH